MTNVPSDTTKPDLVTRLRETSDDWPAALVKLEREAADEIERLQSLIVWCRPRLRHEAYRMRLDAALVGPSQEPDHTPIVRSVSQ